MKDYKKIKKQIEKRLKEFESLWKKGSEKDLFAELCFCICTPQSKAKSADKAICLLKEKDLLYAGTKRQISKCMTGVRFHNNKAKYIIEARKVFKKSEINVKSDIRKTRDWLVKNIKGLGYKEASHFLRNIGFGSDIAILDRHILKNLKKEGVINEVPKTISKKQYFDIEEKMQKFSKKIKIPMPHLDLLFWYREAGEVFK